MKPVCKLIDEYGNIFNMLGTVRRALKEADQTAKTSEMAERVLGSKSYDEALQIIMEYVEVE